LSLIQPSALPRGPVFKTRLSYAGFWWRLLAYLIDAVVLGTVQGAIAVSVLVIAPDDFRALANVAPVAAAMTWAYYALLESSPARGTLGKIALNLFVGDLHGDPITFWRASVRFWLKILSSLTFMVGWLLAAFTPRKQALHDLLGGTVVLRRSKYLVLGPDSPTEPGEYWDGTRWAGIVSPMERA
jgi:uncharacterized RDD family membrane protein YckC